MSGSSRRVLYAHIEREEEERENTHRERRMRGR